MALVLVLAPDGLRTSADESAERMPVWAALLPSLAGIALTLALPRRLAAMPAAVADPRRHRASTWSLLGLAVLFPLSCVVLALGPEDVILAKGVLLMLVAGVLVAVLRPAVTIARRPDAARWWAPAVVIVVWVLLAQVAPWNPSFRIDGYDLGYVIAGAVATAVTAGIGEELFYRRWLQTRLEARLGAWGGIGVASLAFALMHLASHRSGDLLLDVATVIAFQGSFGVFVGVMWMRYRTLWAIILVHLLMNGWSVAAALLAARAG